MNTKSTIKVANCSGFYGDRLSAAKEMISMGDIDYLTGDYLAELTMLILYKSQQKNNSGYARSFLAQFQETLNDIAAKKIKVIVNAGGLDPIGLSEKLIELIQQAGLNLKVGTVTGDNIINELDELQSNGVDLSNMDTSEILDIKEHPPVTANVYLGIWPIVELLNKGADVIITGRITDAALVMAATAFEFGWKPEDLDQLAGALVAGHVIECGTQATGGNYSFFEEVPTFENIGFPIAEFSSDGTSTITKHQNTGGLVSIGTITSQLLYEIGSPYYLNPDVTADFRTINLEQTDNNRVRISGVKGLQPPTNYKVAINLDGGYKNSMTFVLTGLKIKEKAKLIETSLLKIIGNNFEKIDVKLIYKVVPTLESVEKADLEITVRDQDANKVGRNFSNAATSLALANYPGLYLKNPPGSGNQFGIYWPTLIPKGLVTPVIYLDLNKTEYLDITLKGQDSVYEETIEMDNSKITPSLQEKSSAKLSQIKTQKLPLGTLIGARSGDKGGNANVGFWAKSKEVYGWLVDFLTVEKIYELMGELKIDNDNFLKVDRYILENIFAVNFVIHRLLGRGVASSLREDPQAKSLGEYFLAQVVEIPNELLQNNV